jgi:hypothetical protein
MHFMGPGVRPERKLTQLFLKLGRYSRCLVNWGVAVLLQAGRSWMACSLATLVHTHLGSCRASSPHFRRAGVLDPSSPIEVDTVMSWSHLLWPAKAYIARRFAAEALTC